MSVATSTTEINGPNVSRSSGLLLNSERAGGLALAALLALLGADALSDGLQLLLAQLGTAQVSGQGERGQEEGEREEEEVQEHQVVVQ